MADTLQRCEWPGKEQIYIDYHDEEWGVPIHDDRHLFELLMLEGAQAGLSWITVLKRREGYRRAFDNFDANKIVRYDDAKIAALLQDTGIIRNKLKVNSVIRNARGFLDVQAEFGSFDSYIWQFIGGEPRQNAWVQLDQLPAETEESKAMSKALKKRGFNFVGPTICYAFMQSAGMVNDHVVGCFRYEPIKTMSEKPNAV